MVSGYAWNHTVRPWFEGHFNALVQPMVDLGYRWAIALGNHDDQADLNRTQIVELDQTFPLSLTQVMCRL